MFSIYRRLKWLYSKFKFSYSMPFLVLISYTLLGAVIFRNLEAGRDEQIRDEYKNSSEYAFNQVLDRMLEVRCHDEVLKVDRNVQVLHAKNALLWYMDYLNLTQVIADRTSSTPWTWWGSMFYAGQLYTTIGYGFPTAKTKPGKVFTIIYIMIGIPVFLIILKDVGRIMSRGLRKMYKRYRSSKNKIAKPLVRKLSKSSHDAHMVKADAAKLEDVRLEMEMEREMDAAAQNRHNQMVHLQNAFPIPLAVGILALWILFSSSLFCVWETDWGLGTSIYFFFVSISTVGLGDIVPSKPDMMIFNFILILIGLALLSMCFNLIQQALERLLDALLAEYIEEIEKMADIVTNEEGEEEMPIEFKMTGNLLQVPLKPITEPHGVFGSAKSWMAEHIAEKVLASRLGPQDDSESDEEKEEEKEEKEKEGWPSSRKTSGQSASRRSSSLRPLHRFQLKQQRPLLKTIQTLERIKPVKGDFRSMVFSKFVNSERLTRLVEDQDEEQKTEAKSVGCCVGTQTDEEVVMRKRSNTGRRRLHNWKKDSTSTISTCYTNSMMVDDESVLSAAYCDLKFDYEVSEQSLNLRSTLSILRAVEDEPLPAQLLMPGTHWRDNLGMRSPPSLRLNLNSLHPVKEQTPSPKVTEVTEKPTSPVLDGRSLQRAHSLCGLLPQDFEAGSLSSRSTMIDSGYDKREDDSSKADSLLVSIEEEPSKLDEHIVREVVERMVRCVVFAELHPDI